MECERTVLRPFGSAHNPTDKRDVSAGARTEDPPSVIYLTNPSLGTCPHYGAMMLPLSPFKRQRGLSCFPAASRTRGRRQAPRRPSTTQRLGTEAKKSVYDYSTFAQVEGLSFCD